MQLQKNYATNDPYAKNRDSVWLGNRKKRSAIPWAKVGLAALGIVIVILFFALREPTEDDLPGADPGPATRSNSR